MTIGSLFAGIGGLEMGLERAGLGPVLWQVEQDDFCRSVLAKHWPDADRSVTDVCEANASNLARVDVVCGGFPCVDTSAPGRRTGLDGDTSGPLWREFLRIVRGLRPRVAVIENSAGLALRGLDRIVADLSACGYDSVWLNLSAHDLGFAHGRARTWLVAHTDTPRLDAVETSRVHADGAHGYDADGRGGGLHVPRPTDATGWRAFRESGGPEPGVRRGAHGFSGRVDMRRLAALGNAVVPDCAEVVGWIARALGERDERG